MFQSPSADGEQAGADGQGCVRVAGAELAVGAGGLTSCSRELLSLMVLLLSHGCAAVAEPPPRDDLLDPRYGVKSSISVSCYCSSQSLLPWAPAAVGFQLN